MSHVLQCLQLDCNMQGSFRKISNQHSAAKNFILTLMYVLTWHMGSRWYIAGLM